MFVFCLKSMYTRIYTNGKTMKKVNDLETLGSVTDSESLAFESLLSQDIYKSFPIQNGDSKDADLWLGNEKEGQLSVDVFRLKDSLLIVSVIAGVSIDDIDIYLDHDMLTIRGKRENKYTDIDESYIQECFWGRFSRSILLPEDVDTKGIEAILEKGILSIKFPIKKTQRKINVTLKDG